MAQPDASNSENIEQSVVPAQGSLGKVLREAREQLGFSVMDVSNQIKFAPRQIEALEADDFQRLPEAAFLRGFVRSYAKILQLDERKLLAMLPQMKEASMMLEPVSVGMPLPHAGLLKPQNLLWLGAAVALAVIAGGVALWNYLSPLKHAEVKQIETPLALPVELQPLPALDAEAEAPVIVQTSPARNKAVRAESAVAVSKTQLVEEPVKKISKPVALPDQTVTVKQTKPEDSANTATSDRAGDSTQSDPLIPITQLRLEFDEDSWTEIKDRDDKILSSKVNLAGSALVIYGRAPFSMLIGHGLSVRLFHQGKQVDILPYVNKSSEVAHVTLK